jgi:hypothetical protein
MTDKIGSCIADIISISRGSDMPEQQRARAERRIADLLRDANAQIGGHSKVLQDLRDRLGQEINLLQGRSRELLDNVIDFVDVLRGHSD